MPPHFAILLGSLLALGGIEVAAWWWMHPTSSVPTTPVLAYRPHTPPAPSVADLPNSPISSTTTPLPDLYRSAAPVLRCTSGEVFRITLDDDQVELFAAWFEWDATDTGGLLEAFSHPPEACMGSVGMKFISREPPIPFTVGTDTLIFDHTIFRDPGASDNPLLPPVHAFRAVWIATPDAAATRANPRGPAALHPRAIRLRAAITRQRPTHARVIQAAVRGHHHTQDAWNTFEQTVLQNLTLTP